MDWSKGELLHFLNILNFKVRRRLTSAKIECGDLPGIKIARLSFR